MFALVADRQTKIKRTPWRGPSNGGPRASLTGCLHDVHTGRPCKTQRHIQAPADKHRTYSCRGRTHMGRNCNSVTFILTAETPLDRRGLRDVFQLLCSRNMSHIRDNAHMHAGLPAKVKTSPCTCKAQKTFGVCFFKSCCDHCWQPCHRWPLCECRGHKGHNLCSAAPLSSLVIF